MNLNSKLSLKAVRGPDKERLWHGRSVQGEGPGQAARADAFEYILAAVHTRE
jgi:hypothetical protein